MWSSPARVWSPACVTLHAEYPGREGERYQHGVPDRELAALGAGRGVELALGGKSAGGYPRA
jgi:hypothetical protein